MTQIFLQYIEDMKKDLRPDQQGRKWSYYKSCTEAKMRREAGHVFLANAIWTIGLPRLPLLCNLEAIAEAIHKVLEWLDCVATTLLNHRTTPEYHEALRKSGVAHGQSGLSATERETRAAVRKIRYDMRTAKDLARRYDMRTLTWRNCYRWQRKLLEAYWDGSLQARWREVASADTMCRRPSLAMGSATEQTAR